MPQHKRFQFSPSDQKLPYRMKGKRQR